MTKSKIFMFLTILFFLSAVVFSQTITVTSPDAGDTWYKGSTHNITWTTTGISASTNMKINIFKDSINQANFVEQFTSVNDGMQSWPIANSYATGTYYIRIKTADNATYGDSGAFTISLCERLDWDRLKGLLEAYRWIEWGIPKGPWPDPDPDPRFSFEELREIFSKARFRERVKVELFKGGEKIGDLGTFGSKFIIGGNIARLTVIPKAVVMKGIASNGIRMLRSGGEFKLVFKNMDGKIMVESVVELREQTRGIR